MSGTTSSAPDQPAISKRLTALVTMLRDLSLDDDPVRSVNRYAAGMRRLFGDEALISVSLRNLPPGQYRVMRLLHQHGVTAEGLADLLFAGVDAPAVEGGILGAIIEHGVPTVIRDLQAGEDPVLGCQLAPYRFLLGFPVFNEGEARNWMFFLRTDPSGLGDRAIETRVLQANLMGGFSNSKRVNRELREATAWINREIDEIANLQRALLPETLPSSSSYSMAASYHTFARAGGDFYTVFPLGETGAPDRIGIFIADASGHGPSAAVVIAMLSTLLRACPEPLEKPAAVLDHLNQYLCAGKRDFHFITACYAVVHPGEGRMDYACAGHPMPLHATASGQLLPVPRSHDFPLGIDPAVRHRAHTLAFESGGRLLFYTDGITETRNPENILWGVEGLARAFAEAAGTAQEQLAAIRARLNGYARQIPPQDDQTLLLLQMH